jgi:extracellular factor (EF) 3-hydroxypalmitic acid methyl ester biosynthesis protein
VICGFDTCCRRGSEMAINEVGTGTRLLDWAAEHLSNPQMSWEAMELLFNGLCEIRNSITPEEWQQFSTTVCAGHPLREMLDQDPITHRSYSKPRGYAGDAVLLDLIYQDASAQPIVDQSSAIGKQIYNYMVEAPAARAVRLRRDLIAATIDEVAGEVAAPDIFSIACGHLREIQYSNAVQEGRIRRFYGLDHDAETIRDGVDALTPLGVQLVHGNALHLLKGQFANLGHFDFIYASGLFDYLNQNLAKRLAEVMFGMLKPGGRMLIINAIPGMRDTGYMESFMGWCLIYRDLDELVDVASCIPRDEVAEQDVFLEDNQNFAFLQLRKQA